LEIILWAGLLFFFWTLKDGLGRVEDNMADPARKRAVTAGYGTVAVFTQPERRIEPIGSYMDQVVYRYVVSNGRHYQFDCILAGVAGAAQPAILPHDLANGPCSQHLYLAPGLLYLACPPPAGGADSDSDFDANVVEDADTNPQTAAKSATAVKADPTNPR
ncbi:MAG: hypothetical protein ACRYF5_17330, partial [Janthinobacterium lividum]